MNDERKSLRMRHQAARRRTLTVAEKAQLTPNYLSIRFECRDFGDFVSASADDHIKLFLPGPRTESGRPNMRDYTPRAFDPQGNSFVIDFALHPDPGPATAWAIGAQPGDTIEIGGPRGSVVISDQFATYWLIGDEAAIPAIARRMAESPQANLTALIAVAGADEEVPLPLATGHNVRWAHRPASASADPSPMLTALADWFAPDDDSFVWIAAEVGVAKALREAVLATGHRPQNLKASGYWTMGMADTTAKFD